MPPLTKLDPAVISLLCCPFCKDSLTLGLNQFTCTHCASEFPLLSTPFGSIYDFRIHRPTYIDPNILKNWGRLQAKYERLEKNISKRDSLQDYLDEIDSVKEIYTKEFHITGTVLDVGGHQGRLRHFLCEGDVPVYISVDPFINVFSFAQQPNLMRAYPCLSMPVNFLSCHAENLPFSESSFDWVHMRSVVDHFADPFWALKEAYRVLKPNGKIMIGLSIMENIPSPLSNFLKILHKPKGKEILLTIKKIVNKLIRVLPRRDDHNFRLGYKDLCDLIGITGFDIEKEHWQKPPFSYVLYISARKILKN